jgi:putative aminopeptidase FrvX
MGDVTVSFGSGSPRIVVAASVDEPGYVVSQIQSDGYLRVQRLPQTGLPPHYNELQNAQPMDVTRRKGKTVNAVTAGLSIHLEPGRVNPPDPDDLDNFYLDMGAPNAAAVLASGVDVLSPVAAERHLLPIGEHQWAGTAVGDRYGAALLLDLAHTLSVTPPQHGTITLAFTVQQWVGARGLTRVLEELHPDELIYVGRGHTAFAPPGRAQTNREPSEAPALGSGAWVYGTGSANALEAEFEHAKLGHTSAASLFARNAAVTLPERTAHLGVPLLMPLTAGETLDEHDLFALRDALAKHLGVTISAEPAHSVAAMPYPATRPRPTLAPTAESLLETISTSYGVSGAEAMTREAVNHSLPAWAHTTTDASGNLILHLGTGSAGGGIVFMAHTDELGFRVRAINADGTLDLENKGGGTPAFYWGHPALVHTSAGMRGGVVKLPANWESREFHFPSDFRVSASLYVGAANAADVEALGIHVNDFVTIPKRFRILQDKRVSIRSLDDRVGCAAMVRAVWQLGPAFKRNVTFVWSTREELGLQGAGEYAAAAAKSGDVPATIFAIDTFVSSDSPIESHRFADGKLGAGFVVRAIDGSNIVPWKDVQRVQALAAANHIPVQYGITGGGNDGSAFLRYGTTDVALSWPLRYSHSPAELIDTRDLDALAAITEELARTW